MTKNSKKTGGIDHTVTDDVMEFDAASEELIKLARSEKNNHGVLPTLDELATRRSVNSAIEAAAFKSDHSSHQTRGLNRRWIGIAVAAAVLLTMSVFLWQLSTDSAPVLPSSESPAIGNHSGAFSLVSGRLSLNKKTVEVDEMVPLNTPFHVDQEDSVFAMDNGIAMAAAAGTELSIIDDGSAQRTINLISGRVFVALDPAVPRGPFHVSTNAGTVTALGTVFTVYASSEEAEVRLFRGKVAIVRDGFSQHILEAGQRLVLGADTPSSISEGGMLEMKEVARKAVELGVGAHLKPLLADSAVVSSNVSSSVDKNNSKGAASAKIVTGAPLMPLKALMKQARKAKLDGDWIKAAKTYREAVRRFPSSGDAGTALASLGQLYLDRLAQPKTALGYYSKYRRAHKQGPLLEEAMYGQSRCYRALGKAGAEKKVLRTLLSRYPAGLHANIAAKRIAQLKE